MSTDDGREDGLTRRGVIGTGALAGLGAALGADPAEAARRHRRKKQSHKKKHTPAKAPRHADFVIVGAGFAGLMAARQIVKAGHSCIVLEARDRVGGRVLNHDLGGGKVSERGGTFVGPTQDHLYALAKDLGIATFDVYDDGNDVYVDSGGNRYTWSDTGPTGTAPDDPVILPELLTAVADLDQMASTVPVDAPWTAGSAAQWDSQTLDSWIQANSATPQFRELVPIATRAIFGAEPRELSLLFVLFYIASSGNETNPGTFERNFDTRGGGQQSRFVGGSQLLPLKMAAELGSRVILSSPVRRIDQTASGVTVTSDRATVTGKRVIVALPPTLAGRIAYSPDLPTERDQFTQRVGQGTLFKVAAVYDKPFWRDAGLTGQALSPNGFVSATFDDSPPDGNPGVVFGFVGGDKARTYNTMSLADRRAAVLAEFVTFFGPQAASPRDYFETIWTADPWSRGCPVAIYPPGAMLAYGPSLRAPVGRIHWAGTETSVYWNGYMDGAIRSGERAAAEVLEGS
jgi:monoamine oxidase